MSLLGLDSYTTAALIFLAGSALLAGLARGFSGFGAALIFIPLASTTIGPKLAAPLLMIVDLALTFGLIPKAWPKSDKRDVGFMTLGAIVGVPIGTVMLAYSDPIVIRWMLVVIVLPLLLLLMSGWRYHGRPAAIVTVGTGTAAGFLTGIAQVGGPPVILYWLGSLPSGDLVRANIISYLAISSCITFASYLAGGLLTPALAGLALVTAPAYGLGLLLGSHMFGFASDETFRRVCYALIAAALVISLPVLDGIIR